MLETHQLTSEQEARGRSGSFGVWLYLVMCGGLPAGAPLLADDPVDLFPIPKHVEWRRDDLVLDDEDGPRAEIVIDASACAKTKLGVEEIIARCVELGGRRLPVHQAESNGLKGERVLIGRAGSSLVDGCLEAFEAAFSGRYALSRERPGDQGYIIRGFLDRDGRRCALIGGSDEQGVLYGCYSFLQLMWRDGGRVVAVQANMSDFPDF